MEVVKHLLKQHQQQRCMKLVVELAKYLPEEINAKYFCYYYSFMRLVQRKERIFTVQGAYWCYKNVKQNQ